VTSVTNSRAEVIVDFDGFARLVRQKVPVGLVLENPGRGTTTIIRYQEGQLCYRRGQSRFYVELGTLHEAYARFRGEDVTTNRLKEYRPETFDSSRGGHNCNATVLFLMLVKMDLAGGIWGRGQRGAPFGVSVIE
jgi:hypothetical protein